MNITVTFFFLFNVLAALLLGLKFVSKKEDKTLKNFGIALLLDAVAYMVWSVAVLTRPENLETYITVGVAFFIVSLVYFLIAGTQSLDSKNRTMIAWVGVIIGAVILYVRAFVLPSSPGFSADGFFFFNPHPVVQLLYILGLLLAVIPAIDAVAARFKAPHGAFLRYGFIAEVAGGVVLITSSIVNPDVLALNIAGWIIGLVYLGLLAKFVFSTKAWL